MLASKSNTSWLCARWKSPVHEPVRLHAIKIHTHVLWQEFIVSHVFIIKSHIFCRSCLRRSRVICILFGNILPKITFSLDQAFSHACRKHLVRDTSPSIFRVLYKQNSKFSSLAPSGAREWHLCLALGCAKIALSRKGTFGSLSKITRRSTSAHTFVMIYFSNWKLSSLTSDSQFSWQHGSQKYTHLRARAARTLSKSKVSPCHALGILSGFFTKKVQEMLHSRPRRSRVTYVRFCPKANQNTT